MTLCVCWLSELTSERIALLLLLGWSIRLVRYLGLGAPVPFIWHNLKHETGPNHRRIAYTKIEASLPEMVRGARRVAQFVWISCCNKIFQTNEVD